MYSYRTVTVRTSRFGAWGLTTNTGNSPSIQKGAPAVMQCCLITASRRTANAMSCALENKAPRQWPCADSECIQCCQLSNFVAEFSSFSDYPSNFFFQKHLATNWAILKIDLATLATFDKWLKPEPNLPIRKIRKLRRGPLCSQRWFNSSFVFEFGQRLWKHEC